MKKPLIAVVVEGGVVQSVVSDGEPPEIEVLIIDYDQDNLTVEEEKELAGVPQEDGSIAKAHVWSEELHPATIDLHPAIARVFGIRPRDLDDFNYLSAEEQQALIDKAVEVCIADALRDSSYLADFILHTINEMDVATRLGAMSGEEERQRELLGWNPRVQCSECRARNLDECTGHVSVGP